MFIALEIKEKARKVYTEEQQTISWYSLLFIHSNHI